MAANTINSATLYQGTISRSDTRRAASVTDAYAGTADGASSVSKQGDSVQFSQQGKLLSDAARYANTLDEAGDVRPEVIENARKLIESGELFSKDAIRQAARNLRKFL